MAVLWLACSLSTPQRVSTGNTSIETV